MTHSTRFTVRFSSQSRGSSPSDALGRSGRIHARACMQKTRKLPRCPDPPIKDTPIEFPKPNESIPTRLSTCHAIFRVHSYASKSFAMIQERLVVRSRVFATSIAGNCLSFLLHSRLKYQISNIRRGSRIDLEEQFVSGGCLIKFRISSENVCRLVSRLVLPMIDWSF